MAGMAVCGRGSCGVGVDMAYCGLCADASTPFENGLNSLPQSLLVKA